VKTTIKVKTTMAHSKGNSFRFFQAIMAGLLLAVLASTLMNPDQPAAAAEARQTDLWLNASQAEFAGWQLNGTRLSGDTLQLDSANLKAGRDPYVAGGYNGGNYYNGGSFSLGEALAPYYSPPGGFDSAIVSWNAITPPGTWVELRLKALVGSRWSREYVMGIWSSDTGTIRRHSVNGQSDADGQVDTDTLTLNSRASAFQLKAILYTTNGATPRLSLAAVNTTRKGDNPALTSSRAAWGKDIAVPERSQMIYPDGGEVWCSPTSASMVLAYWAAKTGKPQLDQTVPTTAARTMDWIYDGNGNWPFNTAYAASYEGGNIEAYVTRMLSLSQLESWIEKGIPVIVSIAYKAGQLDGSPIPSSNGHLLIVRGFDRNGNVIANDPAADPRINQKVRLVYDRAQFEQRWLANSGGAAYLIYPKGSDTPTALRQNGWAVRSPDRVKQFADPSIGNVWTGADQAVAAGGAGRGWLWGPQPNTPSKLEKYTEGPGGSRLVQYFDKSRMEITRPQSSRNDQWFVTNGLLTVEMVSGSIQVGDSNFISTSPAAIPVAGDPDSAAAPTYATFYSLASVGGHQATRRAPNKVGQPVTATLDKNGNLGQQAANGVTVGSYENTLGHNIPNVMWSWMNDPARSGLTGGWLFALGYPITEPYWVQINLQGKPTTVLVQLFERRALTYTPGNPAAFQIEMGNIGMHYLAWRNQR
jgi:hypothetical protein